MSVGKTRQNPTKKRSLFAINEHFEEDFNTVLPSAIVFQQPANADLGRIGNDENERA
jgi:hypothetical protein